MYNEKQGRIGALLVFTGLNVTFFPQFIMGSRGMPRRYYNYLPEFQDLHQLSTIGAYVLGLGFLLTAYSLVQSLRNGPPAPANPWGSRTLEWTIPSPPPYYNFHTPPIVTRGPYDGYDQLVYDPKIKGYVEKKASA
jgi:cytochrome c oxidase subunit I